MLQWIKSFVDKRCQKRKQNRRKSNSVAEKSEEDNLNHMYEEIPDVIPANWRGVRSESVPSFFLIATEDHSFVSENMEGDNASVLSAILSPLDQSYETPQNCLGYRKDDTRLEQTERNMVGIYNESPLPDLAELHKSIDTVTNYRDRLSCVQVSCNHNHSSAYKKLPGGDDPESADNSDKGDNFKEEELSHCSVTEVSLEPSWEKYCDNIVSTLFLKSSTFTQSDSVCHKDYSHPCLKGNKRNVLLRDLIQRNYDRVY